MSDCGITNFGGKFYISTTEQDTDLDESGFAALTYTEVPNLGNHGDTGVTQNLVTYNTWGRVVVCKAKGQATAQDFTNEFLDVASAGMTALVAAADPTNTASYAYKTEWADGSIEYNRGPATGPAYLKGGNEDFKRVQFTIGANQVPVRVAPTP